MEKTRENSALRFLDSKIRCGIVIDLIHPAKTGLNIQRPQVQVFRPAPGVASDIWCFTLGHTSRKCFASLLKQKNLNKYHGQTSVATDTPNLHLFLFSLRAQNTLPHTQRHREYPDHWVQNLPQDNLRRPPQRPP